MKLVTFCQPMAPFGVGDTRLVPDDVAEQLERDGIISDSCGWPAPQPSMGAQKPKRAVLHPMRPAGKLSDQRIAR